MDYRFEDGECKSKIAQQVAQIGEIKSKHLDTEWDTYCRRTRIKKTKEKEKKNRCMFAEHATSTKV